MLLASTPLTLLKKETRSWSDQQVIRFEKSPCEHMENIELCLERVKENARVVYKLQPRERRRDELVPWAGKSGNVEDELGLESCLQE